MASARVCAFLILCLCAALAPLAGGGQTMAPAAEGFPGWPASFEGRALRELPLTSLERRFERGFPGRIGRFTDGQREIVLRWVGAESRKLHPAADCFKANGYRVVPRPLVIRGDERWSSFIAERGGEKLVVLERIHDGKGGQWSDFSAWYWATLLGQGKGPWWAVTVAWKHQGEG